MTQRLLVVGDAGGNTGFERVVRGICTYLHGTGKYAITVRGIGYTTPELSAREYPYSVKPWGGQSNDPLGVTQFPTWLEEDRPDQLLVIQDLWHIANYMAMKPTGLPTTVYFPVDTPNLKGSYCLALGAVSEAVSYTAFGAREAAAGLQAAVEDVFAAQSLQNPAVLTGEAEWFQFSGKHDMAIPCRMDRVARFQNPAHWNVVPHGMDQGTFEVRSRDAARARFGIPHDAFVVLNVNTNQFRKRQDLTLRAFKGLIQRHPDAFLVLHAAGGDKEGWDLLQLARYLEIPLERIMCVHYSHPKLSDDDLCWLYNTADVQINTAGGEGWGLTAFEGAACGVPQLVPNWSATRELWKDHGLLLPVSDYRVEPKGLNTCHAVVDVAATVRLLCDLRENPTLRSTYSERALAQAARQVSWDAVGAAFDTILQNARQEPAPRALMCADLLAQRDPARSELQGCAIYEAGSCSFPAYQAAFEPETSL